MVHVWGEPWFTPGVNHLNHGLQSFEPLEPWDEPWFTTHVSGEGLSAPLVWIFFLVRPRRLRGGCSVWRWNCQRALFSHRHGAGRGGNENRTGENMEPGATRTIVDAWVQISHRFPSDLITYNYCE